jgi:hypothetical protein
MAYDSPFDLSAQLILERFQKNSASSSARVLSSALRISTTRITDILSSLGSCQIAERFSDKLDLNLLNQYKIVLSKSEGCELLRALGVKGLSDKNNFLNRHIDSSSYNKIFKKPISKYSGRGYAKVVLTYAEVIYFYTEILGRMIPDTIIFPESLVDLADEGDILFSAKDDSEYVD